MKRWTMPSDLPAEQQVLGSLLSGHAMIVELTAILNEQMFADPAHGVLYGQIRLRAEAGLPERDFGVDAANGDLGSNVDRALEDVGGIRYLHQLADSYTNEPQGFPADMARRVRDTWMRRRIIEVAEKLVELATLAGEAAEQDAPMSALASAYHATVETNVFAWAIDAQRNSLPTHPAVGTVQGLFDPDAEGKVPDHVVALHQSEIRHLHRLHVDQVRLLSRLDPKPNGIIRALTTRIDLFNRLLSPEDEDNSAAEQFIAKMESSLTWGVEIVDGNIVDMRHPDERERADG